MKIRLVNLIEEDFNDYKYPGMLLGFPYCSGKCNKEAGDTVCQNEALRRADLIDISIDEILERYRKNNITRSLIFGGLEPFDSFEEMSALVKAFYEEPGNCDPVVIYTGYYPSEIEEKLRNLYSIKGGDKAIIKFGRYVPNIPPVIDTILCVKLSSVNQFAMKLPDAIENLGSG